MSNRLMSFVVPALAVLGVVFTVVFVFRGDDNLPLAAPVAKPAQSPFPDVVAGAGLVEAASENINIGTELSGIVATVHVKVGDRVKRGDPLFSLDDRAYKAEIARRETVVAAAEIALDRLEVFPRAETLRRQKAVVRELAAQAKEAHAQSKRFEGLIAVGAVSVEESTRRRTDADAAKARLDAAKEQLAEYENGTWSEDKNVAKADLARALAELNQTKTDLDRSVVKAPIDGEVLQVNTRPGEYLATMGSQTIPIVMGFTDTLHVRADVDENDAWRVAKDAKAKAVLKGNSAVGADLTFVRVEPFVVPKRSLTGGSAERVDTRVLQVLYAFKRADLPVYVGQQLDVFIEVAPTARKHGG